MCHMSSTNMPKSKKSLYPNRIKELRTEAGFNKKAFYDALKISERGLGYYESGERLPDALLVAHMARLCMVVIEDLYPDIPIGENKSKSLDSDAPEVVLFVKSEIKRLEAKVDDKQKIIALLEEKVQKLQEENALLKQKGKEGSGSN